MEAGEPIERGGGARPPSEAPRAGLEAAGLAEEVERLQLALEHASRQADEYNQLLRQSRLDFAEQRRKLERERAEIEVQARIDLILRILAALDDRAQPSAGVTSGDEPVPTADDPTEQAIRGLLEAEGVEKIHALGALFNPWEHQALQHQTSPELDDQRILAVLRDGYRLGDRVIRPAQVVVARRGP